jgi:hypothetical protein
MGFPVAACTSGTRGKTAIFRVEFWGLGNRIHAVELSFDSGSGRQACCRYLAAYYQGFLEAVLAQSGLVAHQ